MTSILVVDDDDDIRALVGELLERAGHVVIKAPDGESALKLFYSRQPDLVVLDVSMPGLDGWEVLKRIRELSDVPVLMLTARAEELEKVRGLRAGADDYVTKPFGRQELLARVRAADGDVDVHQLNCTYYAALDCDDDRYVAARAIQLFARGVPQIYYVGLLAGEGGLGGLKFDDVGVG